MNAVEIEEAISNLAEQPFDAAEFPYAFLEAFGNKATTIKRLRSGNKSDVGGAVLQHNNIHLATCAAGEVAQTLTKLRNSPATTRQRAKFILATDGDDFQAEDLNSGEPIACAFKDFPNHFGFFLPLAGISTVKQITENAFDIRATSRLNKLYVELLKDNPEWGTAERRPDMNHFMARLIFCFFAEDTDIFNGEGLFTATIEQMSAKDSSNTHEVISEIFRAMNTEVKDRATAKLPRWADQFPYVNGGLFSGSTETPKFSKIARSYLLHVGNLDWKLINPDIFGSMIQAVADDEERGSLGMHYTSVPNILKVLNPLFLDDLREQLETASDSPQKLLNLRKRMARIRVFDPACGSGNFLVIAYKEMRAIEHEINKCRGEPDRRTEIPLTNFRGIELRDFPAEIARLALIIAEYQCDVLYRGQQEALIEFLPLDAQNWITCGNALRLDWLSICPPTGKAVKLTADDLFHTPLEQAQIDFENEGGETYICGNPPFAGQKKKSDDNREDMNVVMPQFVSKYGELDYVTAFYLKASDYLTINGGSAALVSTNSVVQGRHKPITPTRDFWKNMFDTALDDLAQLVVPAKVIFCEGKRLGSNGRNPAFDVAVYSTIFSSQYPDADFIPLGGTNQVQSDGKLSATILKKLAPGIETWMVFDRDDRSDQEIQDLEVDSVRVLDKRDLESYVWEDEILTKLAAEKGQSALSQTLLDKKHELLQNLPANFPRDDIKAISGDLYNFCKASLNLTQCGNNAEAFARDVLALLITPDTLVYQELESIIFQTGAP